MRKIVALFLELNSGYTYVRDLEDALDEEVEDNVTCLDAIVRRLAEGRE